jgi:hypothetical protein
MNELYQNTLFNAGLIHSATGDSMNIQSVDATTLYLILPFKVSQMALLYMGRHGGTYADAITTIYTSDTYRKLETESTKYWHYGPVALLECLESEMNAM